jgi:hypothetical protein
VPLDAPPPLPPAPVLEVPDVEVVPRVEATLLVVVEVVELVLLVTPPLVAAVVLPLVTEWSRLSTGGASELQPIVSSALAASRGRVPLRCAA